MTTSDRDEYNHGDKLNDYPYTVDLIGWGKGLRCTMTVNEPIEGSPDKPDSDSKLSLACKDASHHACQGWYSYRDDNKTYECKCECHLVTVQPGVYTIEDWDRNERGTWYGIMVDGEMVIVSG